MAKDLQKILGWAPLTETLRTTSSGVPNPFPPELFTVKDQNRVLGDRAKYMRISGERRVSKRVHMGSPAKRRDLRDVGSQDVRMLHTFDEFQIDPIVLQQLRSFEQWQQDQGLDWLNYQMDAAAKLTVNNRVITTASVLRYGAIYWDSDGNLLPSSAGADTNLTINYSVPATHQNQCNGNITASWALATTDIPGDIVNLQNYSLQETGMKLTTCLYGDNIRRYISQNSYCQAYLSRHEGFRNKYESSAGELPDGLFGIDKWTRVSQTFYEDSAGTNQTIWDDDLAVFTPDITQPDKMTWWAMFEGSYPVPQSLNVARDGLAALNNFRTEYGQFAYASVTINPVGITVFHGDVFLPGLRNPNAIFQADVAF